VIEMKLPVSDKTSVYGPRPHIRKGYYPATLLKVKPYEDKDGNLVVGKWGTQLIFSYAIFAPDPATGAPTAPLMHRDEEGTERQVIIGKFVYHQYKAKGSDNKFIEGKFNTAITPKSAITKLLEAHGWKYSAKQAEVDPDEFLGTWVEVNIDDYEKGEGSEKQTFSSIQGVAPYKGPEPKKGLAVPQNAAVKKQITHKAVKDAKPEAKEAKPAEEPKAVPADAAEKKKRLKELLDEGTLSQKSYDDAIEQLNA
jgi:hypothetical protein